jgi:hypothetical protein
VQQQFSVGNTEASLVLIFCVDFRELSHLTRDLSQAEMNVTVLPAEQLTQNGQSCHFE